MRTVPKFKVGDRVQFINSGRRNKVNALTSAFRILNIPSEFFRQPGEIITFNGYIPKDSLLSLLNLFIKNKNEVFVTFPVPIFSSDIARSMFRLKHGYGSFYSYLIPCCLLQKFKVEASHPLTDMFQNIENGSK